jgi:hypothetical protein
MILPVLGFGLVGTLFLGLGLFSFVRGRRLLPLFSELGEGIVSGFTEPDDEGFVRPRVQLVHARGTVTITGTVGSNPPAYQVGQRVAVRYPPGRPGLAVIADFHHLYLFDFTLIVFGAASIGTAVLLLVLQRFAT